jgi:2-epi-5-epi-valiolone 7-kinase
MLSDAEGLQIGVFDLGGTWFRWGRYHPIQGLLEWRRVPAINYLNHPDSDAASLQEALVDFIIERAEEIRADRRAELKTFSISLDAPVNAHDMTVLGSGPLWGPTAGPLKLGARLSKVLPDLSWHIVNDITALLAPYMESSRDSYRKTMLITVSSGIGSRLYDHAAERIPYDSKFGVQGEIGHLIAGFEVDGIPIRRQCECGGWNHMNAFASGRGIAQTLEQLPALSPRYSELFAQSPDAWQAAGDNFRLRAFQAKLDLGNAVALSLLDAFVTPLSRTLAAALSLDPDIDRIVITGGVVNGLGAHYRDALLRTFARDGLYQITHYDQQYLTRRLHWAKADDFAGLRGAGIYGCRAQVRI